MELNPGLKKLFIISVLCLVSCEEVKVAEYREIPFICEEGIVLDKGDSNMEPFVLGGLELNSIVRLPDQNENHNAFTDLIYYCGHFFLTFRSADNHAYSKNGVISIYSRKLEGNQWNKIKTFQIRGFDLRDPHFLVSGDSLKVYFIGKKYREAQTVESVNFVSTLDYLWSEPDVVSPIFIEVEGITRRAWPWRMTWFDSTLYTFGYSKSTIKLFESSNGLDFRNSDSVIPFSADANEVELTKASSYLYGIARRSNSIAILRSNDPANRWELFDEIKNVRIGGPSLIFINDHEGLIGGRMQIGENQKTLSIFKYDFNEKTFAPLITLPGKGDLGYPGFTYINNRLYVSYYKSEDEEIPSAYVYFAELELN